MKKQWIIAVALLSGIAVGSAAITIPGSDGSDGALVITENTTIDLSLATLGDGTTVKWDTNNAANAGNGVYDPLKWAVVFKYSSVNISPGVTVTFANHPSRAPVVWLVSGDATIEGTINLNGQNRQTAPLLSEPGPGGFRGGTATFSNGPVGGAGFGPGGGIQVSGAVGQAGSYFTGVRPYGNPSNVPLIGGSGGGGDPQFTNTRTGGGAGAGAILIACVNSVTVAGTLQANGGAGFFSSAGTDTNTGSGAGGAVRIVCDTFAGDGVMTCSGGTGGSTGGLGRIRIERVTNTSTITPIPDPSLVTLASGATALLWPPPEAPTVKILSIGAVNAPDDPRAEFGTVGADIPLPEAAMTQVVLETSGVEEASQVLVRITPRSGANATIVNAVVDQIVTPSPLVIQWTADVPLTVGYAAVQAHVIRP